MLLPNFPGFIPGGDNKGMYLPLLLFFFLKMKAPKIIYYIIFSNIFIICLYAVNSFSLKYFLILISPALIFSYLYTCRKKNDRFFDVSFWLILILSVVSFLMSFFGSSSINMVSEYLFGGAIYNQGVRGTALIFSEPSHAAPFLIIFLHFCLNYLVGYEKMLGVLLFGIFFYATGSGSLFLYLCIYCFLRFKVQGIFILSFLLLFFSSHIVLYSIAEFLPGRVQQIIETIVNLQFVDITQFVEQTASIASGRFISIYVWIYGLLSFPFGSGLSIGIFDAIERAYSLNIDLRVIGAYERFGVDRLPIMPRSFLSASIGTMGVFGIVIFGGYTYLYLRYFLFEAGRKVYDSGLFFVAFFYLIVIGFPGNPFPWLAIYLACLKPYPRRVFNENSDPNKLPVGTINKSMR